MDEMQWQKLLTVLYTWFEEHPYKYEPTISYMGRSYSPEDIYEEVKERTELGESLGNFLYSNSKRFDIPVEEFIQRAIRANRSL